VGNGEERIQALRAALAIAPADTVLRRMLVGALSEEGRLTEAISELKLLAARTPADPTLKVELARTYLAAGQPGPAAVVLEELERAGAMSAEGWRLRGQLLGMDSGAPSALSGAGAGPADVAQLRHDTQRLGGAEAAAESHLVGSDRAGPTFADVGGMDALKEAIRLKILYPAQHPEMYEAYGKKAGGGMLLYGPPGCGKTYLARATAGELGAAFLAVGIADVLDMWIGRSERNLHEVFQGAREHRPSVLFFDEVDALAAARSDFRGFAGRSVVNQFLAELDGIGAGNEGVLVLGATNAPWHIDPAFRRPGRFDEVLFVPPPDAGARAAILRVLLRNRPVADIDVDAIVARTDGFSGADLAGVVERALERKLAASLRDGEIHPLRSADLVHAMQGVPPTTREWFANVRNYVLYANQSGLYDPVRPYLERR
jgi:AAA+ superfamily predicted ATPase